MPSNWLSMDDNFPTFTGEESPKQQIEALHNYLYQMREGLQYSLRNLTSENFNAVALQNMTEEQKQAVSKDLQKLIAQVNQFSSELRSLSARVSGVEDVAGRVTKVEEELSYLQTDVAGNKTAIKGLQEDVAGVLEKQEELDALQETVNGETGILAQLEQIQQTVEEIAGAVQIAEDGSATIGAEEKILNLVGTIYINGVLYEQGGEA